MKTKQLTCRLDHGDAPRWSAALPTWLDGPTTWVQVFGDAVLQEASHPLRGELARLMDAFPRSTVTGCSSAGIGVHRGAVDDDLLVTVSRLDHGHIFCCEAEVVPGRACAHWAGNSRLGCLGVPA
jgi:hypothetical protein